MNRGICLYQGGYRAWVGRGVGSRVGEFRGLVMEVIVGEGAAGGARRIGTGEVSRTTNRKKVITVELTIHPGGRRP